jgi:organic radical activating enzyme
MPEIMKYSEEPIDMAAAVRFLDNLREQNNNGQSGPCSGCFMLEKKKWAERPTRYSINHAIVLNHFTLCNHRCNYCDIWSNRKPMNIVPVLKDLIDKEHLNPNAFIILGGGEPALLKGQLKEIIELTRQHGNPLAISTNSSVFSAAIAEFLSTRQRSAFSRVTTSIDAGNRELYAIKHGKDDFENVMNVIQRYQKLRTPDGARLIVKYIMDTDNSGPGDMDDFAVLVKKHEFEDVFLHMERQLLDGPDSRDYRAKRNELRDRILDQSPSTAVSLNG